MTTSDRADAERAIMLALLFIIAGGISSDGLTKVFAGVGAVVYLWAFLSRLATASRRKRDDAAGEPEGGTR